MSPVLGADTPELVDVTDLGRLLYACLVGRWPGGPAYGLPDAPLTGRHWSTPRQVRAGVSPALDNVCDQVLGRPPRHRAAPITTANELVNALTKVLGSADASGDLERRLRQPIPTVGGGRSGAVPVSTLLDQPTEPTPVVREGDGDGVDTAIRPRTAAADASPLRVSQRVPEPRPAVAAAVAAPAEPTTATVVRTPARGPGNPVRTGTPRGPRRWVALLLALVLLLAVVGVVGALALGARGGSAADQRPGTAAPPAAAPTTAAPSAAAVLPVVGARDFDPQGSDDQRENPGEVRLAHDGDLGTRWRTLEYRGNPHLGGLKRGVGLVLDLGSAQPVGSVQVSLSGRGTDLELRVPKSDPAGTTRAPYGSDADWRAVATDRDAGSRSTLTPDAPVTTRFVLVYLTSLPEEGGRYRGGISEVVVRG